MKLTEKELNEVVTGYNNKSYTIRQLIENAKEFASKKEEAAAKHTSAERYNSKAEKLSGEVWKPIQQQGWSKYEASNKGRIRWNGQLIKQDDELKGESKHIGYLVLDRERRYSVNHYCYVYTMIAMAFLGKKPDDGLHVHHINNNGYDCRPENLILLTRKQHAKVHSRKIDS
ncbi:MAG: HNH endonuclease [Treponema sp.]|nr:HNH endonuclease [Treponema sp.]